MLIFAKFVMRDSGLPIHINTPHVTQVRLTLDGEPAIYLVGKETPIVVEGSLQEALKKLEAAGAGFRLVEADHPAPATITALPTAAPVAPPAPVASAPTPLTSLSPVSVAETAPKRTSVAKARSASKKARSKSEVVAVQPGASAVAKKLAKAPAAPPPVEQPSGPTSWFKGLR